MLLTSLIRFLKVYKLEFSQYKNPSLFEHKEGLFMKMKASMKNDISVDDALKKGHQMITYPILLMLLVVFIGSILLGFFTVLSFWAIPIGIGLYFLICWGYWSIMITKWRLWAFENVRNVNELRQRAVCEMLICEDGHKYEKTEYRTKADTQKWLSLQYKFKNTNIFEEQYNIKKKYFRTKTYFFEQDANIPNQTNIFFSRKNTIFITIFILIYLLSIIVILFFTKEGNNIFGTLIFGFTGVGLLVLLYLTKNKWANFINNKPQIILSEKGLKIGVKQLILWNNVVETSIKIKNSTYKLPLGTENLNFDDYTISMFDFEILWKYYYSLSEDRIISPTSKPCNSQRKTFFM